MSHPQAATERVGRYQILELIGGGPNGTVSRAKVFGVAGFERQFAVKRFSPELTVLTQHAQALSSAARAYGSLEHPRIARMSEFGVAGGLTFTAVEHVAGVDALRLMAETKNAGIALPHGGVLAIVSQAARAIGYAHGRGIFHLGLAPTNVLVNVDGDVKVTDFGLLAATWPSRPLEVARLATRIAYCAPEQLANEAMSAATDVFALGVLAYELVTGHRAFRGDSPHAVAQAILAGPPSEPILPRPIVRVLQRCLARSPFERFPDARALADALDAALRVAPVPGTRKDVGTQVKAIIERLAALNEGQMSGMLALPMGGAPSRMPDASPAAPPVAAPPVRVTPSALGGRRAHQPDPKDAEAGVGDTLTGLGPGQLAARLAAASAESPASTIPEMPRPISTVAGVAPPPIPVPPGIATGGGPPPSPTGSPTIMGITAAKRAPVVIPRIQPVARADSPAAPAPPAAANAPVARSTATPPPFPAVFPPAGHTPASRAPTPIPVPVATEAARVRSARESDLYDDPAPEPPVDLEFPEVAPTAEIHRDHLEQLHIASGLPTGEVPPIIQPEQPGHDFTSEHGVRAESELSIPQEPIEPEPPAPIPVRLTPTPPPLVPPPAPFVPEPPPLATPDQPFRTTPQRSDTWTPPQPAGQVAPALPASRPRWPWITLGVLSLAAIATAGWYVFVVMPKRTGDRKPPAVASTQGPARVTMAATGPTPMADAAVAPASSADAMATTPGSASTTGPTPVPTSVTLDAGTVAATPPDAAVTVPAPVAPSPVAPGAPSDSLEIASTPPGARVFIDGADQGVTPVKLPGSTDHHTLALLLAGQELYTAQVDGHGKFSVELKPVTPHGGPAGIKVIKCKDKERYYVFVDGAPTGMTCPTERIHTDLGTHIVEVYDVVTESRQKWDITITDTRLSYRVRIEN